MFDYSNLTKKDLVSDVESTFKKSRVIQKRLEIMATKSSL